MPPRVLWQALSPKKSRNTEPPRKVDVALLGPENPRHVEVRAGSPASAEPWVAMLCGLRIVREVLGERPTRTEGKQNQGFLCLFSAAWLPSTSHQTN